MTVPTERPTSTSLENENAGQRLSGTPHDWSRRRRAVAIGSLLVVALLAAVLVYVFPPIAVPVGTALAFVAAVPPLMQWLGKR